MGWVSEWLTRKIAELGTEVNKLNAPNKQRVIFFLKGGRALNYYLGTPEKGENDWDTQVVINPHLPAEEWYDCFNQVHDRLLVMLTAFKAEFTDLVQKNAAQFAEYLKDKSGPAAADVLIVHLDHRWFFDVAPDEAAVDRARGLAELVSARLARAPGTIILNTVPFVPTTNACVGDSPTIAVRSASTSVGDAVHVAPTQVRMPPVLPTT